jgi:hypothetical protein
MVDVVVGCGVEVATHEAASAQCTWRMTKKREAIIEEGVLIQESIQSEPSRTRCGPSFARTRRTSGTKAYVGFVKTEYAKTKLVMRSRQT